jgi:group I intron endonuclease
MPHKPRRPYPYEPGVYKILNIITGQCYVGSTTHIANRVYNHEWHLRRGSHKNPKFAAAWEEFGREAFVFVALEIVSDKSLLLEREQVWIDRLDAAT